MTRRFGYAAQAQPSFASTAMTWNEIETNWLRFGPLVRRHWFRLTESDLVEINGRRDVLARRIADRYDLPQTRAELEVDAWAWLVKLPPGVDHVDGDQTRRHSARNIGAEQGVSLRPARQWGIVHRILDAARVG